MGHVPEHHCPVTTEPALCYHRGCEGNPCDGAKRQSLRDAIRLEPGTCFSKIATRQGITTAQARELLHKKDLTAVPWAVDS